MSRREFFAGFMSHFVTEAQPAPVDREPPGRLWLRPPGARPETEFLQICTRCTDCIEACPHQAIRRLGPEFGDAAGSPAVIPAESPCYLCPDMPCIPACTPRALFPIERAAVRMGLAVINDSSCLAVAGQPCDYCVVRCPLASDAIRLDHRRMPVVNASGCAGCGVCAYLCPGGAIRIDAPLPT